MFSLEIEKNCVYVNKKYRKEIPVFLCFGLELFETIRMGLRKIKENPPDTFLLYGVGIMAQKRSYRAGARALDKRSTRFFASLKKGIFVFWRDTFLSA